MAGSKTINNPLGAFGYTDAQNQLFSIVAEFKAQSAVAGPAAVAINTTGNVAAAPTGGVAALVPGICINSPAAGEIADVIIHGIAKAVTIAGTVALGDLLIRSVTTAGRLSTSATPAVGEYLAVAITTGSGANGTVDCWVNPR